MNLREKIEARIGTSQMAARQHLADWDDHRAEGNESQANLSWACYREREAEVYAYEAVLQMLEEASVTADR